MGIVFPHHPHLQGGWMEMFMYFHSLEAICVLGQYMYRRHPPKYAICEEPKVKADS